MRYISAALIAFLSFHASQAIGGQKPDVSRVIGDLCATPDHWAPPFTHVYRLRNGSTVVFVAVEHTRDLSSPTMAQIRAAFERYKPTYVLVEGASLQKSADNTYLKFLADRASQQFAAQTIQENLYAVKLASDNKVSHLGWDLSPHEEYVDDIAEGFTVSDAIGAHLLRSHVDPFEVTSPSAVQAELSSVPHVRQPESFDFAGWYHKAYGDAPAPTAGTPCGKGIASEIIKFESTRRTLNIVSLLDSYAKPGAVILVEAGANHWLALRDYLSSISKRVS